MKLLIISLLFFALTGCAGIGSIDASSAGFTFGTIKQIENGNWTREAVLEEVAEIRETANLSVEIDTNDIVNSVLERSGIESAADRYLAAQFLSSMQRYVVEVEVPEGQKVRLNRVLDAVERGAMLAY